MYGIRVEIIVYLTSSVYLIHLIQYQQNSDLRMPIRSTLLSVMHSNTISKSLHKTFLILSADCPIHSRFLYYLKCVALYSYSWNVNNVYVYTAGRKGIFYPFIPFSECCLISSAGLRDKGFSFQCMCFCCFYDVTSK